MLPNPLEEIARKLDEYNKRLSSLERLEGLGAWTLIEDINLSIATASFDFQNIPATFKHLYLMFYLRSSRGADGDLVLLRFNNDSGNNYDHLFSQTRQNAFTFTNEGLGVARIIAAETAGSTSPSDAFDGGRIIIPNYANTTGEKVAVTNSSRKPQETTLNISVGQCSGYWRDISAISRVTVFPNIGPNYVAGSRISLYGIS